MTMLNDYLSTPILAGFPEGGKPFLFAGVRINNGWSYLGAAAFVVALGLFERLLTFAYKDLQLSASSPSRVKKGRSFGPPQRGPTLLHRRSSSGGSRGSVSGVPKWQRHAAPARLPIPLRRTSSVSFGPDPLVILGSHGATDELTSRRRFRASSHHHYKDQQPLPLGLSPRPTATLRRRLACLSLYAAAVAARHLLMMIGLVQMDWVLLILMVLTSAAGQLLVEILSEATERNYDPDAAAMAFYELENGRPPSRESHREEEEVGMDDAKEDSEMDDVESSMATRLARHEAAPPPSTDEELEMQEAFPRMSRPLGLGDAQSRADSLQNVNGSYDDAQAQRFSRGKDRA